MRYDGGTRGETAATVRWSVLPRFAAWSEPMGRRCGECEGSRRLVVTRSTAAPTSCLSARRLAAQRIATTDVLP